MLDTEVTSTLVDNLTSLSSSMERVSKVTDVASLSFEEQYDILKDYPQLIDSMERGYLTAGDTIDLFKQKTEDAQQEIENSMESIKTEIDTLYGDYKKMSLNGVSFSHLFDDTEVGKNLRNQLLSMSSQEILELVKTQLHLTGEEAEEMANKISGYVTEYSNQSYFNAKIDEEGWAALLDPETLETLNELTDQYTQLNDEIERQDDLLGRFNEGSELYNETLEKRNRALLEANKVAAENREELQKQLEQRFEDYTFKDKNGKIISLDKIFTLDGGIDNDVLETLDKDSKGIIQEHSEFLKELLDQDNDYYSEVMDN